MDERKVIVRAGQLLARGLSGPVFVAGDEQDCQKSGFRIQRSWTTLGWIWDGWESNAGVNLGNP